MPEYTPLFTQQSLDAINIAIANGASKVKYADKEIEYRSLDDLMRIRSNIESALGINTSKGGRKYASFNKGFN